MLSILDELRIFYNPYFLFVKMEEELFDIYRLNHGDGVNHIYVPSGERGRDLVGKLSTISSWEIVESGVGIEVAKIRTYELDIH